MRNKTIFVLLTICLEDYVDELIVKDSHDGDVVDYASSLHARYKVALRKKLAWEANKFCRNSVSLGTLICVIVS